MIEDKQVIGNQVRLKSIQFRNYKALNSFSLTLHRYNVLVGPNNNGKSTIIGALRLLATAMRKALSSTPESLESPDGRRLGWQLASENIPISLENVHTDYSDSDTTVVFEFSNENKLLLFFPKNGGCRLFPLPNAGVIRTKSAFRDVFGFRLAVVPVLGPIEHREPLLRKDTVQSNLLTHRASRHFRNYWHYFSQDFDNFAEMIASTWPGMKIQRPFTANFDPTEVFMFAEEDRIPRELYWCGFGFQIWCQLLTHIARNRDADLLIVDEPEVYLHPDVQRQLLGVLRDAGPAMILATHSTEIMAEAEPNEIVLIDKKRDAGRRLNNARAVQAALAHVGSIHTMTLVEATRQRRILYVSDVRDLALLKRFATAIGCDELSSNTSLVALSSGGLPAWKEIQGVGKRAEEATGTKFLVGAIYGRGTSPEHELEEVTRELTCTLDRVWLLEGHSIENYLLNSDVLDRVVLSHIEQTGRTPPNLSDLDSRGILSSITDYMRDNLRQQFVDARLRNVQISQKDVITAEAETWFDEQWSDLHSRLNIVPGRQVLSAYRTVIGELYGVSFSDGRLAESFNRSEVSPRLVQLLYELDRFTRMKV